MIGTSGVLANRIASSALSIPSMASEPTLGQVAEWIDRTGQLTVIRGPVAHALGFPDVDLRVRERGFRKIKERFTHVCSTCDLSGYEDIVFLASVDESTGDAVVWRATRKGQLIATAQFLDGTARPVSNEDAQTAFVAEKEYLVRQRRTRVLRASPTSAPKLKTPSKPIKKRDAKCQTPGKTLLFHPSSTPIYSIIKSNQPERHPFRSLICKRLG